ncbi:hypothetical protein [Erythrobacter donghaensis]|uniref:hypothetical protein n=1 Tax=Erythrobacter donghaensis TaxID=267135 RepID=UPI001302507E|nr:hypothetical protein [Erythrobacter donghaensis]
MIRSALFTVVSFSLCMSVPSAGAAASKDDEKMMRLVAECAYVVRVAEGNGVRLNNSAATWDQAKAGMGVKLQIDPARYDAEARAKYKVRERKLGSEQALRGLIQRARDCDAQL